ncbi:MAG: hypothetical protein H7X89_04585 [Rhizobiales bacterium]|nr:hypothetical protein [Hyphomicrobiales bacterium]
MSSEGTSSVTELAPDNFEAIEKAVMESQRGRWFLEEYARRRSGGETKTVLTAIGKLENTVAANQDLIAERLGKALGLITSVDSKLSSAPAKIAAPPVELSAQHMKFFKQDEELFEAPAKPAAPIARIAEVRKAPEPRPDVAKGAKLVIRRQPEPASESEYTPIVSRVIQPDSGSAAEAPATDAPPKSRIVIIRHKAGETINVPFHDEMRASA